MKLKQLFKTTQIYVFIILVLYCVLVSVVSPQFATLENMFDIVRNISVS